MECQQVYLLFVLISSSVSVHLIHVFHELILIIVLVFGSSTIVMNNRSLILPLDCYTTVISSNI